MQYIIMMNEKVPQKKTLESQFKEVLIVKEMRKALDIYLKF